VVAGLATIDNHRGMPGKGLDLYMPSRVDEDRD
jgi:hypothetical protein